jgi:hypothetical protein
MLLLQFEYSYLSFHTYEVPRYVLQDLVCTPIVRTYARRHDEIAGKDWSRHVDCTEECYMKRGVFEQPSIGANWYGDAQIPGRSLEVS